MNAAIANDMTDDHLDDIIMENKNYPGMPNEGKINIKAEKRPDPDTPSTSRYFKKVKTAYDTVYNVLDSAARTPTGKKIIEKAGDYVVSTLVTGAKRWVKGNKHLASKRDIYI